MRERPMTAAELSALSEHLPEGLTSDKLEAVMKGCEAACAEAARQGEAIQIQKHYIFRNYGNEETRA